MFSLRLVNRTEGNSCYFLRICSGSAYNSLFPILIERQVVLQAGVRSPKEDLKPKGKFEEGSWC
jgi:hypothetical protein